MDHNHNHEHHNHEHQDTVIPAERQAVCIVTGDTFDIDIAKQAGHYADYNEQTYYFCCATCLRMFNADPSKYIVADNESSSLTLTSKECLTENIWSFRFTADPPLAWIPGQFIRVEVMHEQPDAEGTTRWFTISSTPHDEYIQITTRITDTTFKQALAALNVGDSITLVEHPQGDFVWQEDEKPLLFIAGGIGVTPFYSMLKARGHSGQPVNAILIYNGRDDKLPFKEEFTEALKRHPEFKLYYVLGRQLTVEDITGIVPESHSSQVYISGPEPMVETLGAQLVAVGLPKPQLHQDYFPNYSETNY